MKIKRPNQVFLFTLFWLLIPPVAHCEQKPNPLAFKAREAVDFLLKYKNNRTPVGDVITSMERQGCVVKQQAYCGGTEARDCFFVVLHGKYDVMVVCELDKSNVAVAKALDIPYPNGPNDFDLKKSEAMTGGPFWSHPGNKSMRVVSAKYSRISL